MPPAKSIELRCTYDPATKGGNAPDGRKVKATLHWVAAADSVAAEVRLYNPLFTRPDPDVGNFAAEINPNSLEVIADARVEPALAGANSQTAVQFERQGYFCPDPDSTPAAAGVQPHRRSARHVGEGVRPRDSGGGGPPEGWWRGRLTRGFVIAARRSKVKADIFLKHLRRGGARAPSTTLLAQGGPPSPLSRGRMTANTVGTIRPACPECAPGWAAGCAPRRRYWPVRARSRRRGGGSA